MNGTINSPEGVVNKLNKSYSLATKDISARGWLLDVLLCMNSIPGESFSLAQMYSFEDFLSEKHPNNFNVRAKIRQQLQLLRNKGYVEFLGNGNYNKL